jgi:membrane peptidoglycan carboxypeptidase
MTVREAFRRSVNLVFIRLMRDITRYHIVRLPSWSPSLFADRKHPGRAVLLRRFADREGIVYLDRFLEKYRGLSSDKASASLHLAWRRLGYPFDSLVPSYATAIDSSGDTPPALAELLGIIQNGGRHYPTRRITSLRFAEAKPTETWLRPRSIEPEQVLDPAVAQVVRQELVGVVDHGTGRRIAAAAVTLEDGTQVEIGGKTGTGDNRIESR